MRLSARQCLAFLTGCLLATHSVAESVVLVLRNGDRVSGVLLQQSDKAFTVSNSVFGKVSVPLAEVKSREAVPATNAVAAAPKPAPAPAVAAAPVKSPTAATNAPAAGAAKLTPPPPAPIAWWRHILPMSFATNWHGNLQLGVDMGYATTDRQLYFGSFQAGHVNGRWRNNFDLNMAHGRTAGVLAANRLEGNWKIDQDLKPNRKLYLYNLAGGGYDEVSKIDLKYQEGIGVGYKIYEGNNVFFKDSSMVLNGELGAQYQEYHYSTLVNQNNFSLRLGQDLTWRIANKMTVTEKLQFFPSVEDMSIYRARLDLTASYPLTKVVSLNIVLSDEYNSNPPPSVESNDLQIRSTIGVRF